MDNKSCLNCGSVIISGRSDKKFCTSECRSSYNWNEKNSEKRKLHYENNKADYLEKQTKYRIKKIKHIILAGAKRRAKQNNIEFNLTLEDIVIPEYCPLLGIKLASNIGEGRQNNSATLDKIIPEVGYTKGNVWIISWKANRLKSNLSHLELAMFCTTLLKKIN